VSDGGDGEMASTNAGTETTRTSKSPAETTTARLTPDTYWLMEGASLLLLNALGGLRVQGEENVPPTGPVLLVSNHVSYLDPVAIGDACPRRVAFMGKAELFETKPLGFLLRGVDAFPVRRGASDRTAFKNTLALLADNRVVCIFPEGTRRTDGVLGEAETGAATFALRTGCPVVPIYVSGSNQMLDAKGKLHPITVAFGAPFTLPRETDRAAAGARLMVAIAETRDAHQGQPSRRIWPHWITKPKEGRRATRR